MKINYSLGLRKPLKIMREASWNQVIYETQMQQECLGGRNPTFLVGLSLFLGFRSQVRCQNLPLTAEGPQVFICHAAHSND